VLVHVDQHGCASKALTGCLSEEAQSNGCLLVRPYAPLGPLSPSLPAAWSSAAYVAWHHSRCGVTPGAGGAAPPPVALCVRAGTVVALSPYVWHCSGPNRAATARRAYMPQYSAGAVVAGDDRPVALAVPMDRYARHTERPYEREREMAGLLATVPWASRRRAASPMSLPRSLVTHQPHADSAIVQQARLLMEGRALGPGCRWPSPA
jgi:ectoine hydroxylase-related dioxygenase (phytanoyl-CoA dioxygenase family)